MQTPIFSDNEFVNQTGMTDAFTVLTDSIASNNEKLFTAGLVGTSGLSVTTSGLTLTVDSVAPFSILFGNGYTAEFTGYTDGQTSTTATLDASSLIPVKTNIMVYLVATLGSIQQGPYEVTGPPVGYPDYSSTFVYYTGYTTIQNGIVYSLTTTPPDNVVSMAIASFLLTPTTTSIPALDYSGQVLAGAILSRNGEVLGSDLGVDAAATNVGELGGALTGTLPNPQIALQNSGVTAGSFTTPFKLEITNSGVVVDIIEENSYSINGAFNANGNGTIEFLNVSGGFQVQGGCGVGGSLNVNGYSYFNGGANVINASTFYNPIALNQLSYIIPLTFQNFTNVTGSRSIGTVYTNTYGKPMFVSVSATISGDNSWGLYVNGQLAGASALSGSGGAHQTNISAIVPAGAQYQVGGSVVLILTTFYGEPLGVDATLDNWCETY